MKLNKIITCLLFLGMIFIATGTSFAANNNELKENYTLPDPSNTRTGVHYTTLQAAINDAGPGDTITAEAGTYYENLQINKDITLIGADKDSTFIDGKNQDSCIKISPNVSVTITGFTLQNGKATYTLPNTQSTLGGGIFNNQGNLNVNNCIIKNNNADIGAGIMNFNGNLMLNSVSIQKNTAKSAAGGLGNMIFNQNLNCLLNNCTITDNTATQENGGAIENYGNCTIKNCTIQNNNANNGNGGGISNTGALTITNTSITNNSARYGGGIYSQASATCTITDCNISNNSATIMGGGIYNAGYFDS
jgi:predicted outer membrane repeat protein